MLNKLSEEEIEMGDIQTFFADPFIHLQILEHIILTLLMRKLRHRRLHKLVSVGEEPVLQGRYRNLLEGVIFPDKHPPSSFRDRRWLRIE